MSKKSDENTPKRITTRSRAKLNSVTTDQPALGIRLKKSVNKPPISNQSTTGISGLKTVTSYSNIDIFEKIVELEQLIVALQKEVADLKNASGVLNNSLLDDNKQLKSEINYLKSIGSSNVIASPDQPSASTDIQDCTSVSQNIETFERKSHQTKLIVSGLPLLDKAECLNLVKRIGMQINCPLETRTSTALFNKRRRLMIH